MKWPRRGLPPVAAPLRSLAISAALLLWSSVAVAESIVSAKTELALPLKTGSVVDEAGILDDDQQHLLETQFGTLYRRVGIELVVVTLPSLQGHTIEAWGALIRRDWYLGDRPGTGAALIVAPQDRQVRIEVADGLAKSLTDAEAKAIIDQRIVPMFEDGNIAGGILIGADAMITEAVAQATGLVTPPQSAPVKPVEFIPAVDAGTLSSLTWVWLPFVLVVGAGLIVWMGFVGKVGRARGRGAATGSVVNRRGHLPSWSGARVIGGGNSSGRAIMGRK